MSDRSAQLSVFVNHVNEMRLQIDAVEASLDLMTEHLLSNKSPKAKISDVLGYKKKRYPSLHISVANPKRIQNKVRTTNYEFVFQALYTYFTEYLRGVLSFVYETAPLLIASKANGAMNYTEIAKLGSYENIKKKLIDDVFRKLENERSTAKLIGGVLKGSGIELDQDKLDELLMYMEIRHLLVHRSGKLDMKFIDKYADISKVILKVDRKMPMTIGFVRRAIKSTEDVAKSIDSQMVELAEKINA